MDEHLLLLNSSGQTPDQPEPSLLKSVQELELDLRKKLFQSKGALLSPRKEAIENMLDNNSLQITG